MTNPKVTITTDPAKVKPRHYTDADHQVWVDNDIPDPLLTEAAGPVRCRDCGTWIERGDPCVDLRDQTGDVLCQTCADEEEEA
jgi:hypothetical protein